MSDNPSAIRAIARTKTVLDGTEFLEGSDLQGSFKASPSAFGVKLVTTGLVASTIQTLVGALPLAFGRNIVVTVANVGDSVSLPALSVGQTSEVYNNGANALKVWPATGLVAIDGGVAGAAVTLSAGKRASFLATSATSIISAQMGAPSA